jgi:hypothetical protein
MHAPLTQPSPPRGRGQTCARLFVQRHNLLPWQYIVVLVLPIAVALLGCIDKTDNVTARDVENRTFMFDSSFIDTDLEGLQTILAFQSASDDHHVAFTLTLQDVVTSTNEATVSDTATVNSIELPIGDIELREVTLPDPIEFKVRVDEADDGTIEFTFTNDNGTQILFEFRIGEMDAVATPVRPS